MAFKEFCLCFSLFPFICSSFLHVGFIFRLTFFTWKSSYSYKLMSSSLLTPTERLFFSQMVLSKVFRGLPWWCSGWGSACRCGGRGFGPWSGRILHAVERLGLWATVAGPARLEPVLRNRRGRNSERSACRDEEWPLLAATGEGPGAEVKTQHSQK